MSHLFRMPPIPSLFLVFNLPPFFCTFFFCHLLLSFLLFPLLSLSSEDRLFAPSLCALAVFCVPPSLPTLPGLFTCFLALPLLLPPSPPTSAQQSAKWLQLKNSSLASFHSRSVGCVSGPPAACPEPLLSPVPRTSWLLQAGKAGAGVGREEGIMIGKEKD